MDTDSVLSEALSLLRRAGVRISGGNLDALSLTLPDRTQVEVRVHTVDAPLPAGRLRLLLERPQRLLIVSPRPGRALIEAAAADDVDLITLDPASVVIGAREHLPAEGRTERNERAHNRGRSPWGRWAVERALVLSPEPVRQQQLADSAAISQPAVAKYLKSLSNHVSRSTAGWEPHDRRSLLKQWLANYQGPQGASTFWYSLDTLPDQARKAAEFAASVDADPLVSGDLAADFYSPWRLPDHVHLYVRQAVDLTDAGFSPAAREDATLTLTIPQDPTLWATARDTRHATELPLADPLVVLADLIHSDSADNREAVERFLDAIAEPKVAR